MVESEQQAGRASPDETSEEDIPANLPNEVSHSTLHNFPLSMVLSDPRQDDNPIIYVNRAFVKTTGYSPSDVVGRNCRFLQGEQTREADRMLLRDAIAAGREVTTDILNYRADGSVFINRLMVAPLHDDETGELTYFLGVQTERESYTSYAERAATLDMRLNELQHRVKNHLAMILSMIRMETRSRQPQEVVSILTRRVEALGMLYDQFTNTPHDIAEAHVDLGAYLSRVASAVHGLDGKPRVVLNTEAAHLPIDFQRAGLLGLLASEILTNAFQHAFANRDTGRIAVSLAADDGEATLTVADDGQGMTKDAWPREDSLGGRIAMQLAEQIEGTLDVTSSSDGTTVILRFPVDASA